MLKVIKTYLLPDVRILFISPCDITQGFNWVSLPRSNYNLRGLLGGEVCEVTFGFMEKECHMTFGKSSGRNDSSIFARYLLSVSSAVSSVASNEISFC
jgi:hypothetical protein